MNRSHPHSARAFTLVELVVTLMITAILAAAIGSAIMLASKAMPESTSPTAARAAAGQVAEDIVGELQTATSITRSQAADIEFKVADRNGDGQPETIRYTWNGTAGTALQRSYNGGTAGSVLANVREFALTYQTKPAPRDTELLAVALTLNCGTGDEARVRSRALTLNQPTLGGN